MTPPSSPAQSIGELGDSAGRLLSVRPLAAHFVYREVTGGAQPQPAVEQRSDLEVGQGLQQRSRGLGQAV